MRYRERVFIHLHAGPGSRPGFGGAGPDMRIENRTIDVTPGAGWRRIARSVLAGALLIVGLPLLWLVGGLVMLALVGAVALLVLAATLRPWWARRAARRQGVVDSAP